MGLMEKRGDLIISFVVIAVELDVRSKIVYFSGRRLVMILLKIIATIMYSGRFYRLSLITHVITFQEILVTQFHYRNK